MKRVVLLLGGVTGIRAPCEGRDGLLGQVEVRLGVVEDPIGDLENSKIYG